MVINDPCMYNYGHLPIKNNYFEKYFYFIKHIKGNKCTNCLFTCINLVLIIDYLYIYAYVDRKGFQSLSNLHVLEVTKVTKDCFHQLHVFLYLKILGNNCVKNNHLFYHSKGAMKIKPC